MFECQDADFRLNYVWAYSAAQQLECSDTWIQYLSKNLRTDHLYRKSFRDFLLVIRPEHRATLVKAAFDTLMGQAEPLAGKRIWRPKLLSWASQLIEDSLNIHQMASESEEESSTSVCDDVIDHIAWTIYACAKAQWGASVAVWHSLKDLGLGLALHSLYIAVTGSTALEEYEKVERWISILRIHDDRNTLRTDFDILFKAFGLLTNLNALALMLDAVELYDLSMRLLQAMIYDYEELSWKTKDQLGYVCDVTLSSLSRHLEEVRQRKVETLAHDDWYYDDVLEDWVERSPKTDRICRTSWQSSDEEEEHARFSPTTKTRRSVDYDREDAHSDVSFDSLADNARTPPRNKDRTSTRISPFVLRSPIHFAMTPLTRPNLADHQTASCYAELEDLDHYQNITQDEEDDEAQEADDEDQEEEQSVDEFEVSATLIPDIMGDGDPDLDCYGQPYFSVRKP
ncbi:hypothetical protein BGZ59_006693 [Podila verticillata]|nr:hypothetical protein BGZ59_006693 [Podila verticillata]